MTSGSVRSVQSTCWFLVWLVRLAIALFVALGVVRLAHAQVGVRALPALSTTPRLRSPDALAVRLAGSLGYGMREALAPGDALHHTLLSALGAALMAPFGLSGELRVDGRLENHTAKGDAGSGMVGELRGYLRYAAQLPHGIALGTELSAWVPGGRAPSLRFSATTLDAVLVMDTALGHGWGVVLAPGFRLDHSARAMPNASQLSTSDFVTLGLSSANALLARAGVVRAFARGDAFVEWTWDALVGKHSGPLSVSPMQVAMGGSLPLDRAERVSLQLTARALVSQRAQVVQSAHVLPFPPRAELWCALKVALQRGQASKPPPAAQRATDATPAPRVVSAPPAPEAPPEVASSEVTSPETASPEPATTGQVRLLVRDERTGKPLVATVRVRRTDAEDAAEQTLEPDGEGRLSLDLTPGRYRVQVRVKGYRRQVKSIAVEADSVTILDVALHARSER